MVLTLKQVSAPAVASAMSLPEAQHTADTYEMMWHGMRYYSGPVVSSILTIPKDSISMLPKRCHLQVFGYIYHWPCGGWVTRHSAVYSSVAFIPLLL